MKYSWFDWHWNFNSEEFQPIIQAIEKADKKIAIFTGEHFFYDANAKSIRDRVGDNQMNIRGLLTRAVDSIKDWKPVSRYYIWDEINPVRYGGEQAWMRTIIESVDLDHPTTATADNPVSSRPGVYARTTDFIGYDPYVITGKPDQDISGVYDRISEGHKLNPNRPIFIVLQGFWYYQRGDLRGPTQQEFRNMVFQALCAGTIMFETYAYKENTMADNVSPGTEVLENWYEYMDVYREIKYLRPIILSVEPAPYYKVEGGDDWLNTMAKRYDGKSYLFTVNNQPTEKVAIIHLEGVKKIRGMYSKKIYEADDDGNFEVEWEGYETEVFEFEQEAYKSSHAELKNFVTAGVIVTDAESEVSTVIVPDSVNEIEYRAYVSDFANIYINETKVEECGKLSLEGLKEIKVKVVSEDGRFTTEKTYLIKRG